MQKTKSFPHISKDVKLSSNVTFRGDIYVYEKCEFGANVLIDGSNFRITIGKGSKIDDNSKIISETSPICLGANITVGKNCLILSSVPDNGIIGDNSTIKHIEISPDNQN